MIEYIILSYIIMAAFSLIAVMFMSITVGQLFKWWLISPITLPWLVINWCLA